MIELTSGDGHSFSAYRAEPTEPPKGAVVVLPDVYGVTPHLQREVDSFAAHGYVAIAPALVAQDGENAGGSVATALQEVQAAVDAQRWHTVLDVTSPARCAMMKR